MPNWLEQIRSWLFQIIEIGLALIALGIVLQILFGNAVEFLPGDVIGDLTNLIQQLGDNGLVGLIALAIILYLYTKKRN